MNTFTTINPCTCTDDNYEQTTDYIIDQVFGWLTNLLALVGLFVLCINIFIKKTAKGIGIPFVIIRLIQPVCGIVFGIRIDQLSVWARSIVAEILGLIILGGFIVFTIRDKKKLEELKKIKADDNPLLTIDKLQTILHDGFSKVDYSVIEFKNNDIDLIITDNEIKIDTIILPFTKQNIKGIIDSLNKINDDVEKASVTHDDDTTISTD